MPFLRVADVELAKTKGIPAPTPVRDTFHKGDAVMQVYEVEYHLYAQKLVAAGIWKQHWADGETYKTGDQLRKEHRDDIKLIRELTQELEGARHQIEKEILSKNKAQADLKAFQAKYENLASGIAAYTDPFEDLVVRSDLVWQGYGYETSDERQGIGLCRRGFEAVDPKRLWMVTIAVPPTLSGEGDGCACCYGDTKDNAINVAHHVLDLMMDYCEAKGKKAKGIKGQILKYMDDVGEHTSAVFYESPFDESGTEGDDL